MERKFAVIIGLFASINAHSESIGLDVREMSRLTTNYGSSPNSVTVLYREDIEQLGARNIPELLQYVPGITMARAVGNAYRVSYLNGVGQSSRGIGIKIDGVSYYTQSRIGLSKVDWDELPVDLSDIEKIEVIRSPDSAEFGGEAFSAMINIVTRKIASQQGISVVTSSDFGDNNKGLLRYADTSENFDYLLSYSNDKATGVEVLDGVDDPERIRRETVNFKFDARPAENQRLHGSISALNGSYDSNLYIPSYWSSNGNSTNYVDNYNLFLNYRFETNDNSLFEVTLTSADETTRRNAPFRMPSYYLFQETIDLNIVPDSRFAFLFGRNPLTIPGLGDVNPIAYARFLLRMLRDGTNISYGIMPLDTDLTNASLETTYTQTAANNKFVIGLGTLTERIKSPAYFDQPVDDTNGRLFVDDLLQVTERNEIRLGAHYEINGDKDALSYKLAAIHHHDYGLTSKAVYSHGEQIQGPFEAGRNGRTPFYVTDSPVAVQNEMYILNQKADLKNETVDAVELILMREGVALSNVFEVKVFSQKFRNQNASGSAILLYTPSDDAETDVKGAEVDATVVPWDNSKIRLTYAYHDFDTEYGKVETIYGGRDAYEDLVNVIKPRDSGSLLFLQRFDNNITASLSTVFSDEINSFRLGRYDATVTYPFALEAFYGKLNFGYRHYLELRYGANIADQEFTASYENRDQFFFGFETNF